MSIHFTFHRLLWLVVLGSLIGLSVLASVPADAAVPLAAIPLTTTSPSYSQDFNILANGGSTNTILPSGWAFLETGSNANQAYRSGGGTDATGDTYSFGTVSEAERAFGGIQSGNLIPLIGAELLNNDLHASISSLHIAYTGEQWRSGATGREDRIDFQYSADATSLTSGTWTDYDTLDFVNLHSDGANAKNGNLDENRIDISDSIQGITIPPGGGIWVRWVDFNASGNDDGLSVDDFSITATFATPGTPTPLAAELSSFEAHHVTEGISVTWETASENETLGFHLWRGPNDSSPDVRLNDELIPAQSPGGGGAAYEWLDEEVLDDPAYYWLDIVDVNGEFDRHGPVSADAAPTFVAIEQFEVNPFYRGVWVVIGIAGLAAALLMTSMRRKPR